MGDLGNFLMGSFSKIWHLIPIVIAIVLFKKFIDKKDKKRRINKNEENEEKGLTLNLRTREKYEKLGYQVISPELDDDKEELGIDFICNKDDKVLLVQCKNYSKSKSITGKDIKTFHNNAIKYVKTNSIENNVEFRYVVPYSDVLDKSAIKILMDDSYNCKYVIL